LSYRANYAEAQNELGYALRQLGRYPESIQAYQEAIRLNSNLGLAHLGLGDVYYYNTKNYAQAAQSYKRGLELRPGNATAQYNLGWCYNDLERYTEAADELRKAIEIRPSYPEAHNELGYALHQLRRYQEAIQQYMIAIQQKTDYASAHYNLGMSFIAMNNRNAALQQYRILQRIDSARATKLFNSIK
jgi:tetratricopeptide (TPR) repeat protein